MALARLASTYAFKGLRHLIHGQVLRSTHLNYRIARPRIIESDAGKASYIFHRYKIDRIAATPKDDGLALLHNWLTDQLGPEVHKSAWANDGEVQSAGAEILLCSVLDAEEL